MREMVVVECRAAGEVKTVPAPHDSAYSLWKERAPGHEHRVARWTLTRGESIGFASLGDGRIEAVGGDQRMSLEPGVYRWVRPPVAGDRGAKAAQTAAGLGFMLAPLLLGL
jgi:hypothetical protein